MQTQTKPLNNIIILSLSAIIATGAFLTSPNVAQAKRISPKAIKESIAKGVEYIYKQQKPDGSWPPTIKYKDGTTALAIYALLSAGENVRNPKIQKGLDWMLKKENTIPLIYSLGMRCNALHQAWKQQKKAKYYTPLRKVAAALVKAGLRCGGGYGYCLPGTPKKLWPHPTDHIHVSTSQYGVLGVWAAAQTGKFDSASVAFWNKCKNYWIKTQCKDGGWAYEKGANDWHGDPHKSPAMTTAGIASLFLCYDYINRHKFKNCAANKFPKAIKRGLDWMEKTVERDINNPNRFFRSWYTYYLYGLERVGLASGYKYFGRVDWFKEGSSKLLREQKGNGRWEYADKNHLNEYNYLVDTCFAVLFLSRGLHPVGFNKLQFDGDWNNRPRDLAGLTLYASQMYECDMRWQIVNLKADISELHDSPFLYISGSKELKYTDQEAEKLKKYVYQGGTILSVTECPKRGREGFDPQIRKLYKKIFPEYKIKKIDFDHPLFSNVVNLKKYYTDKKLSKSKRKRRQKKAPKVYVISNGARLLAIHIATDVTQKWHSLSGESVKKLMKQVRKGSKDVQYAQLIVPNIFHYVFGNFKKLTPRGTFFWPALRTQGINKSIRVAKLKAKGFYHDPEPLAFDKLNRLLQGVDKTEIKVSTIDMDKLDKNNFDIATITGTGKIELNKKQRDALKKFVEAGGLLFVEAVGGNKKFAKSVARELRGIFGKDTIKILPPDDKIYNFPNNKKVAYKKATKRRGGSKRIGALQGFYKDGKPAVIFSAYDLSVGMVGQPTGSIKGYNDETSYYILRNIMLSR